MFAWSDLAFPVTRPVAIGLALFALSLTGTPDTLTAQAAPERLFDSCVAQAPLVDEGTCADAALAAQALSSGVGLLQSAGGTIPASPSTAGIRVAGSPRIVIDGGVGWSSFRAPDLSSSPGAGGVREEQRMATMAVRATSAVGIFEGFSPVPTVGGILSVDAVGSATLHWLPGSRGFSGSTVGWGAGVRVGVLRESFSLPGVTLSAMHYRTGTVRYGEVDVSGARASLSPRATSIRAVVGRDLLAVGLVGGVGWDRYTGDARIEAATAPGQPAGTVEAGPESMRLTRRYLFAGANYTWLVAQLAGELTWARTPFPLSDLPGTGPFEPGATELQGAISVRITY